VAISPKNGLGTSQRQVTTLIESDTTNFSPLNYLKLSIC